MTYQNVIDSHIHTQSMLQRGMDVFSLYDKLFSSGFHGGIDIGCTHDDLPERREFLKPYPKILLSGAMGPWEAGRSETKPLEPEYEFAQIKDIDQIERELVVLKDNLIRYKASFIGEIGCSVEAGELIPFKVTSDNMEPSFLVGDEVLIDVSDKCLKNFGVYLFEIGSERLLKRFLSGDFMKLTNDKPAKKNNDIILDSSVKCIGRAVWLIRKL